MSDKRFADVVIGICKSLGYLVVCHIILTLMGSVDYNAHMATLLFLHILRIETTRE